jgi:hypothetical protein
MIHLKIKVTPNPIIVTLDHVHSITYDANTAQLFFDFQGSCTSVALRDGIPAQEVEQRLARAFAPLYEARPYMPFVLPINLDLSDIQED